MSEKPIYHEKDFIGMKFNHVTVLSRNYERKSKSPYYNCLCDCGRTFVRRKDCIYNPLNKTCGCCQREKHNGTHTRLYNIYKNMKARCQKTYAKHYEKYGGRGIKVCDEWNKSFNSFREWALNNGYQENLTIDRINNDGNYEPSNCRWVTRKEQSNNLRTNRILYYDGEYKTMAEWCNILNLKPSFIRKRLDRTNNDLDKALKLPNGFQYNHKKVIMIDEKTNKNIKIFNSPTEASQYIRETTNFKANCGRIIDVCVGRRNKAYNYKWKYLEGGDVE